MEFGMDTAWSGLLTAFLGGLAWFLKERSNEIDRIQVLLNRTREEMAKEYVTKADVHADINRVIDRIDTLDAKLDRFLMERKL